MGRDYKKSAYLIIAHKDDLVFRTLLKMLDYSQNDIFIHMDKKNLNYEENSIEKLVSNSSVIHTQRTTVTWGGYSQINAELLLLKEATRKSSYLHYHLLSGADLPIKTQDQINQFFTKNHDKEFIGFEKKSYDYAQRTKYFYPFQEYIGRNLFLSVLNSMLKGIQKILRIQRNSDIVFQKGTNWFSITDELANYVVEKEDWIKKVFSKTFCADEVFLQTLVINSSFKERLYHSDLDNNTSAIMRLIDWNRGHPYTFRNIDFEELCNSQMMFARKFNEEIDSQIIQRIAEKFS